ncbi:hypothetical protein [Cetobacterium sp.]|uniref:hypothetical protein n=1 Tax=Cetobacterium sp. TaxID=2071632 RepID=UPI002FCC614A
MKRELKTKEKIDVLLKVAKKLNTSNITWAIGASLLLYIKGITNEFNDIDIMVAESDVEKTKQILLSFGELQPKNPNEKYKTKCFMEFKINGIDFDIIAGFVIVKNNTEYYFPLKKNDIKEIICIHNTPLPLQSIEEWLLYYKLMDRIEKVEIIDKYLGLRQENLE